MKVRAIRSAILLFLIVPQPLALWAQPQDEKNPVVWSLEVKGVKHPLHPGDKFSVLLAATIAPGWHVYSISQPPGGPAGTVITIPKQQPFVVADEIKAPQPERTFDRTFEMETEFYEESASFTIPLTVAPGVAAGEQELEVSVHFQACNETTCLPPTTVKVKANLTVATGRAARGRNARRYRWQNSAPPHAAIYLFYLQRSSSED